jgi:hypothetical protein
MNIATNYSIPKESFRLACKICEQEIPTITHNIARRFTSQVKELVLSSALKIGRVEFFMEKRGNFYDIFYQDKNPGYLDEDGNFVEVSNDSIRNYNLDINWLTKAISSNIQIPAHYPAEEIIPDLLWKIGIANLDIEVPIFFARRIKEDNSFSQISKALNDRRSTEKGIILVSCNDIPDYFNPEIAGHKIIVLDKCLVHNKKNFQIDKNILKAAITKAKKDGFSNSYRSACFNGEYFRFTKQESEILEFLHKEDKPIHKDEIMSEVTGSSTELKNLFKNPDSKNIRKSILQYDNKGYYWLNDE